MTRLALLAALLAGCTGNAAPHTRAQRIGSLDDTIGGPHAIGTVGDFLLENDRIRLVISDTGKSLDPAKATFGRVNTTYGGSLVDADLQRVGGSNQRGNDQLAELLPGFVFTVIDPSDVCVPSRATGKCPTTAGEPVRDGSDGGAAEVLVTGVGGDLLQMVALLNTGLLFPSNLELSTVYRLAPGAKHVAIITTIKNVSAGAHPFPFLDPTELSSLAGPDLPGLDALPGLSCPVGMLPLFGGEQDLFTPGQAGFNVQYAIEDTYQIPGGFPAFPGMVADFVATRGPGVSYGLTMPRRPDNYVNTYKTLPSGMPGYPMQDVTDYSVLLPFTYAGVAAVYMYAPPSVLQPGEEYTYEADFIVGRGDVASIADTVHELRGDVTGTYGGRVVDAQTGAPVAGASVFVLDAQDRPIDQAETDDAGAFAMTLVPGSYKSIVVADDRVTTTVKSQGTDRISITANAKTGVLVEIAPPATLVVQAFDELGRKAPSKIQLIGRHDGPAVPPGDGRDFLYDLRFNERVRHTAFDGSNRFVEGAWWTKDGQLDVRVKPGTYDLVVTRGPEYEITTKTIELVAGKFTAAQVQLVRSYDTPGWVSGDFHLHAAPSTDSGLPIDQRVISCAAEGLEVATSTDHNFITDYAPVISSSGLDPWLLGIPGMELTTFEMGHFNAYPLAIDPGSTRGGEFRWAFKPPQELFDTLRGLGTDPQTTVVQVNHPRQQVLGYWSQFFVDANTAEPYTPTGVIGVFAPYGDEFRAESYSSDFDAVELLTGHRIEDVHTFRAPNPLPPGPFPDPQPVPGEIVLQPDGRAKFPGTVETWFTMLDRGHTATGMGTSDTHGLIGKEPGYARTLLFVGAGKDTPGGTSRDDVVRAIRGHHAITTNAPFLEMTTANGTKIIGDTVTGPSHTFRIRVRSATWAPVDTLTVYSNSAVLQTFPIPASQGTDFEVTVDVTPATDAWVVAEVTGSANMFPVVSPTEFPPLDATILIQALAVGIPQIKDLPITSSFKPDRIHQTRPYAITNPIWIDRDGNGFAPSKPLLRRRAPGGRAAAETLPDVRTQFDSLPDVSP